MHTGGLRVDADGLRGMGGKVARAAATLRETVRVAGAGLAPAPQPGSAAAAAAQAAEQMWTAGLQRLTGRIDAYSRSLVTAAQEYEAADAANARQLRRAETGTPR